MATEVKVDLEQLGSVWQTYNNEISHLREAIDSLNKTMDVLRASAWKTNGSDEFFRNYDATWKKRFEEHLSYLEHLRDCLNKANTEFSYAYQKNRLFN